MQPKFIKLKNFMSYTSLELPLHNMELVLIQGKTGSGKSTILDALCWVLYGETSKQLKVDEIRSFGTEVTEGELTVALPSGMITIHRSRGKVNDLYWTEESSDSKIRGKDVNDTQKLLTEKLGANAVTYVTASMYHQYSPSATFFLAKAKDRRELFEQFTDLDFPKVMDVKLSERKKTLKSKLTTTNAELYRVKAVLNEKKSNATTYLTQSTQWENSQHRIITSLIYKNAKSNEIQHETTSNFREYNELLANLKSDSSSRRIHELEQQLDTVSSEYCPECGNLKSSSRNLIIEKELHTLKTQLSRKKHRAEILKLALQAEKQQDNNYLDQIEAEKAKINPFLALITSNEAQIKYTESELTNCTHSLDALNADLSDLEELCGTTIRLRAELLKRAIKQSEVDTNDFLSKYFDSEFKVKFNIEDDALDIEIHKNGNYLNFKQLSKGQQQLLRLCFSLSTMKAASNRCGQQFSLIILDEPTDGMDTELKEKAYRLFEDLSLKHNSVAVIEHALELKNMFNKVYTVTLKGDKSSICLPPAFPITS